MLLLALFSWWYTSGWTKLSQRVQERISGTLDQFSIGLLAQTLFDPFRQISAGKVKGPIGLQLRAWADRQFSRVIGAVVRLLFIIIGLVVALTMGLIGLIQLAVWPIIPLLPLIALFAGMAGWTL